jgi:hypothetical protein
MRPVDPTLLIEETPGGALRCVSLKISGSTERTFGFDEGFGVYADWLFQFSSCSLPS